MQSVQIFFSLASALMIWRQILSSEEWAGNGTSILSELFQISVKSRIFVTDITVFFNSMLVVVRDPKMFWVMSLRIFSVRKSCQCLRIFWMCHGHKHRSAAVKMPVCCQHSPVTNPNGRTTQDTIKKIISIWVRPSTVYFCINFTVRWEPCFILILNSIKEKSFWN